MKINKLIIVSLSAIALSITASAKPQGKGGEKKGPSKTFAEADTDKNSEVSLAEWTAMATADGLDSAKASKHFKHKDADKSGALSEAEYNSKPKKKSK